MGTHSRLKRHGEESSCNDGRGDRPGRYSPECGYIGSPGTNGSRCGLVVQTADWQRSKRVPVHQILSALVRSRQRRRQGAIENARQRNEKWDAENAAWDGDNE